MAVTSPLVPTTNSPTQSVNDLPDLNLPTTSNSSGDYFNKRLDEVNILYTKYTNHIYI